MTSLLRTIELSNVNSGSLMLYLITLVEPGSIFTRAIWLSLLDVTAFLDRPARNGFLGRDTEHPVEWA